MKNLIETLYKLDKDPVDSADESVGEEEQTVQQESAAVQPQESEEEQESSEEEEEEVMTTSEYTTWQLPGGSLRNSGVLTLGYWKTHNMCYYQVYPGSPIVKFRGITVDDLKNQALRTISFPELREGVLRGPYFRYKGLFLAVKVVAEDSEGNIYRARDEDVKPTSNLPRGFTGAMYVESVLIFLERRLKVQKDKAAEKAKAAAKAEAEKVKAEKAKAANHKKYLKKEAKKKTEKAKAEEAKAAAQAKAAKDKAEKAKAEEVKAAAQAKAEEAKAKAEEEAKQQERIDQARTSLEESVAARAAVSTKDDDECSVTSTSTIQHDPPVDKGKRKLVDLSGGACCAD